MGTCKNVYLRQSKIHVYRLKCVIKTDDRSLNFLVVCAKYSGNMTICCWQYSPMCFIFSKLFCSIKDSNFSLRPSPCWAICMMVQTAHGTFAIWCFSWTQWNWAKHQNNNCSACDAYIHCTANKDNAKRTNVLKCTQRKCTRRGKKYGRKL